MPKLRHSLGWNSSVEPVNAVVLDADKPGPNDDGGSSESGGPIPVLREILAELVIGQLCASDDDSPSARRGRRKASKPSENQVQAAINVEELQEFIEYLANEVYDSLPDALRLPKTSEKSASQSIDRDILGSVSVEQLVAATPVTVVDSLTTYGILDKEKPGDEPPADRFLTMVYTAYITALTEIGYTETRDDAIPTKPAECELCGRDWITLTIHHLIPRETWPKAVKRGWIENEEEGHRRIAWICRACHNLVHRIASNEELARHWNSIKLLEQREDVQKFVAWAARVRWKKK